MYIYIILLMIFIALEKLQISISKKKWIKWILPIFMFVISVFTILSLLIFEAGPGELQIRHLVEEINSEMVILFLLLNIPTTIFAFTNIIATNKMKLKIKKSQLINFCIIIITFFIVLALFIKGYKAEDQTIGLESDNEKINIGIMQSMDENTKNVLAGVLEYSGEIEEQYSEEKINSIINKFIIKKGIFVSNRAKEEVLKLFNTNTNIQYILDKDNYINKNEEETNNISKQINSLVNGDKCIIIDYNNYYYSKLGNDLCTFIIEETEYIKKVQNNDIIILILNPTRYQNEYETNEILIKQIINNLVF